MTEDDRGRWVSFVEAAAIAGCSAATISTAAQRGELVQRKLPRRDQPSLDRTSVEAWAAARRVRLAEAERQRQDEAARRELGGRPDAEHDWLDLTRAGELLGVSRVWVRRLADRERLPFTVVDGRRWFRREHLEMWRAARDVERARRG